MTRESAVKWVTIDADVDTVFEDLADPLRHPSWATGFFAGEARPGGEAGDALVTLAAGGQPARLRVTGTRESGGLDVAIARGGEPYGPPSHVRLCPNGDGVDVVWVIRREPRTPEPVWAAIQAALQTALMGLKAKHEPTTEDST